MISLARRRVDQSGAYRVASVVALGLLVIDQLTKNWARDTFADGPPREIIGEWLRFTYTKNPGAAFSSFTGSGPVIAVIAVGVVFFLLYLLSKSDRFIECFALGLILGGALGNLSDRIFRGAGVLDGAVVDWIDWWVIPTFNIADAALNVGVAILLIAVMVGGKSDG